MDCNWKQMQTLSNIESVTQRICSTFLRRMEWERVCTLFYAHWSFESGDTIKAHILLVALGSSCIPRHCSKQTQRMNKRDKNGEKRLSTSFIKKHRKNQRGWKNGQMNVSQAYESWEKMVAVFIGSEIMYERGRAVGNRAKMGNRCWKLRLNANLMFIFVRLFRVSLFSLLKLCNRHSMCAATFFHTLHSFARSLHHNGISWLEHI